MQFVKEKIFALLVFLLVGGYRTTEGAPMPNIIDAPRALSNMEVPPAIAGKARPLLEKQVITSTQKQNVTISTNNFITTSQGEQTVYDLASQITDEDDLVPDSSNHYWLEHAVAAGHLHKHKHRRHRRHHKKH